MTVGLATFELHLTGVRSLKEKRMVVSRLIGRLRSRFNVSVAEVGYQDLWQRAALAVVSVASARVPVERILAAAGEEVERSLPGEVIDFRTEFLD